jgi:TM2 domain-containing membrane protein YozV
MAAFRRQHGRGKNKIMAGLLAVVFGFLGVHHFYLGSFSAGLTILVMSCFGVGFVVGPVEGVMLLVMSDIEFDAKYNHRVPESLEFVFQQRP